jgi:hypothetical protein
MLKEQKNLVVDLISEAVRTGYSSVFTFAVKEKLNHEEREEFASLISSLKEK